MTTTCQFRLLNALCCCFTICLNALAQTPGNPPAAQTSDGKGRDLVDEALLLLTFDKPTIERTAQLSVARDQSGSKTHGTMTGGDLAEGIVGDALHLKAGDSRVECDGQWRFAKGFTFTCWVRVLNLGNQYPTIFTAGKDNSIYFGALGSAYPQHDAGRLTLYINNRGANEVRTTTKLDVGKWTFVAATFDGVKTISVSVNGNDPSVRVLERAEELQELTFLRIGNFRNVADHTLRGAVDEIALFPRALSPDEIKVLFRTGKKGDSLFAAANSRERRSIDDVFPNEELSATIPHRLAAAYNDRKMTSNALFHSARAVGLDPHDAEGLLLRGKLLTSTWRLEEGGWCISRALDLRPKHLDTLLARAESYRRMNDYEPALATLDKALTVDPRSLDALLARGYIYRYHRRRFDAALNDFEKAMELHPKAVMPRLERAYVLAWLDRPGDALAAVDEVIEEHPELADAHCYRAQVLKFSKGGTEAALSSLNEALRLNPAHVEALFLRATFLVRNRETWADAMADYDALLRADPYDRFALARRGELHTMLGDPRRAMEDFEAAVNIYPLDMFSRIKRGMGHLELKQWDKAIDDFDVVIKHAGDYEKAYRRRGFAYLQKADLDRAIADLTRAIQLDGEDGRAYRFRAEAWSRKDDTEKALADTAKAAELGD